MVAEIPVPTAVIVCEGDIQTISHISKALKNQLPVIIMKGSGKAADLVLDYLDKYFATHINDELISKENKSSQYNFVFITFMQLKKDLVKIMFEQHKQRIVSKHKLFHYLVLVAVNL